MARECPCTLLLIDQQWFRQLLGAARQQPLPADVDPDRGLHMTSLGHSAFTLSISWTGDVLIKVFGVNKAFPKMCSYSHYAWEGVS